VRRTSSRGTWRNHCPPELRERAVRMVAEVRPDYPSDWPAIVAVANRLGIGSAETLRKWVRRAEVDAGQRPGTTSAEHAEIRRLKREVAELRRANDSQGGVGFLRVYVDGERFAIRRVGGRNRLRLA
jgi:transposase